MQKHRFGGRLRLLLSHTDPVALWTGLFLVLYLLFPGLKGYRSILTYKAILFYCIMGLTVILIFPPLCRELRQKRPLSLTPAGLLALTYLFFTVLSAAVSPYGRRAWLSLTACEGALTQGLYVLLFLVISLRGRAGRTLYRFFFVAAAIFCGICVLQALGRNPLGLYPAGLSYYDGNGKRYKSLFAGTVGNVDLVSTLLAMAVPILLASARKRPVKQSWPSLLLAAVCLGIMLWLRVLCGLVGLLLGAVVCLLVFCGRKGRRLLLPICAALLMAALAALWFLDLPIQPLHELHEILHGRVEDSFGSGRIYIWRQILQRIPDRLLFGVGPDMTSSSGLAPFVRYDRAGGVAATAAITDAHCFPLQILYCQGLPALLSFLALVALVLTHWVRGRSRPATAALGCGIVCFLGAMLFCFSSIIIMPFFWLALGLLEADSQRR